MCGANLKGNPKQQLKFKKKNNNKTSRKQVAGVQKGLSALKTYSCLYICTYIQTIDNNNNLHLLL